MKIEYDSERDLLYMCFASSDKKVAETITVAPGVYADFSREGKLMGIEAVDASEIMGSKIEFGFPETVRQVSRVKAKSGG
ncbi:MAG: DUF2283 domain-containing protein [Dehalococcoidia bacterium]|nr:DUF2283 domain-containing protein [Dehalococcoidia bacterium]